MDSEKVREEINLFLKQNFPQIEMHGGSAHITELNLKSGHVSIKLTGTCDGCGISNMTIEAIKRKMFENVEYIESIEVTTGEIQPSQTVETDTVPF